MRDFQKLSWRQLFDIRKKLGEKSCLSDTEKEELDALEDELMEREEMEIMGDL